MSDSSDEDTPLGQKVRKRPLDSTGPLPMIPKKLKTYIYVDPTQQTAVKASEDRGAGSKQGSSSKGPSCDNVSVMGQWQSRHDNDRSKKPKQVSVDTQKTAVKASEYNGAASKRSSSSKRPMRSGLPTMPRMQTLKPTGKMIRAKKAEQVQGERAMSAEVLNACYKANRGFRYGDHNLREGHALTNPEPRPNMTFWNTKTQKFEIQAGPFLWEYGQGPERMHTVPDARNLDGYHQKVRAVSKIKEATKQAARLNKEKEVFKCAEESDEYDSANEMVVPDRAPVQMEEVCTLADIMVEEGSALKDMLDYGKGGAFDDSGQDSDCQDPAEDEEYNLRDGQDPGAEFFPSIAERTRKRQEVEPPVRTYDLAGDSDSDE